MSLAQDAAEERLRSLARRVALEGPHVEPAIIAALHADQEWMTSMFQTAPEQLVLDAADSIDSLDERLRSKMIEWTATRRPFDRWFHDVLKISGTGPPIEDVIVEDDVFWQAISSALADVLTAAEGAEVRLLLALERSLEWRRDLMKRYPAHPPQSVSGQNLGVNSRSDGYAHPPPLVPV